MQLDLKTVHLWTAEFDSLHQSLSYLKSLLSDDEKERAARFKFERDQQRFIAARGILRDILSDYTNIAPKELVFNYTDKRKPYLPQQTLQFNVSHSENVGVYAICLHNHIGVDVEYIKKDKIDFLSLAKRFFALEEYQYLESLNKDRQRLAFYKLWTAKEAILKASGSGLSFPLKEVAVELKGDKIKNLNWFLESLLIKQDYVVALACSCKLKSVQYYAVE